MLDVSMCRYHIQEITADALDHGDRLLSSLLLCGVCKDFGTGDGQPCDFLYFEELI